MKRTKFFLLFLFILSCLGSLSAQSNMGNNPYLINGSELSKPLPHPLSDQIKTKQNILGPEIVVSTTTINFGEHALNATATQDFTISNPGTDTLSGQIYTPSFLSVAEASVGRTRSIQSLLAPRYAGPDRNALSYSIPAGGSKAFTVSFTPTEATEYHEAIYISHNVDALPIQIDVYGTCTQAILYWQPTMIEVEMFFAGSTNESITLENHGNIPLIFTASRATSSFPFTINGSSSSTGSIDPNGMFDLHIGLTAYSVAGRYTGAIDISSNDPDHSFVRIGVIMDVYNPNHPPVLNLPSEMYVPYNGSKFVDFLSFAYDLDGHPLSYSVTTGMQISYNYSSHYLIPSPNWCGFEFITVTVSDGEFEVSDEMLIIVNGPPELDIPDEYSFDRNDSLLVDFRAWISDPEMDDCTLSFTGNSEISINLLNMGAIFSAPLGFAGSETITISVNDGHNTVQDSFTINVINHAPELDLPDSYLLDQNGSLTVDFTPFISDPDDDLLVLSYSGNSNVAVSIDGYSVSFTPALDWYGSEEISFTLSDGLLVSSAALQVMVSFVISHLDTPELQINSNMNGISIVWQHIEYATEYWVYRASEPFGSYSLIASTQFPLYWDTDPPDKAFYYVKAVDILPAK